MSTTTASLDINSKSAAVANFFGTTPTTKSTSQTAPSDAKIVRTKHRTAGVGSRTVVDGTDNSQDTRLKAILRVGQKRRSDDNEDDELDPSELNADDDDDDDDCRTGIDDTKREKVGIATEPTIPSKKKKKKKGKKERQQDAVVGTLTSEESTQTMPPSGVAVMDDDLDVGDTTTSTAKTTTTSPAETEERRRRHRPKVRSRQKNIYKDKRPMDQKPIHLIPGKKEFGGRPLTAETRTKLVDILPPKQQQQQQPHQYHDNRRHNDNNMNDVHIDDGVMKHGGMRSDEGGLAIDDLLAEDYDAKFANNTNAAEVRSTKPKTKVTKVKRRPKYKNLAV
ncbi:hypothetical protein MHU86_7304 [Fragilaria crotonensis]|nr:hypothetical protein MHU86_7304 [Fragilaria crotonensis]